MTKTYNFNSITNNNPFLGSYNTINKNYSEILDDIILTDIVKKNSYLFDWSDDIYGEPIIKSSYLKDNDFIEAAHFLANYKKNKAKTKFIIGKMYTLADGTPIVFYDDEVQIGFDTYSYSDFSKKSFLSTLDNSKKKIIIKIYGNAKININL